MSAPREPTPGTQNSMVLQYLVRHGSITPKDAMAFGVMRLAARILELETEHGVRCEVEMVREGRKAWARYTLADMTATGQRRLAL